MVRDFLFSVNANEGRKARGLAADGHKGFVVIVETKRTGWQELDAESRAHGETLAKTWVDNGMAESASVQAVNADGSLRKCLIVFSASQGVLLPSE